MSAVNVLRTLEDVSNYLCSSDYTSEEILAIKLDEARSAVKALIETIELRVEWVNGSYYVVHGDGSNFMRAATAYRAAEVRDEAIRAALARVKGGAV